MFSLASDMHQEILRDRLAQMGFNKFQLAKKIAAIRKKISGQEVNPRSLNSAIRQALDQPGRSRLETIEQIVEALDGEIIIRWKQYERVVSGYDEIVLDLTSDEESD